MSVFCGNGVGESLLEGMQRPSMLTRAWERRPDDYGSSNEPLQNRLQSRSLSRAMIRAIYLKDAKGVLAKAQLAGFGMVFCVCGRYLGQDIQVGQHCWSKECERFVDSIARVGDPKYEGTFNIDGSIG